jgi:hypothetical protein
MSDTITLTVKFGVPEGRKSHLEFGQIRTWIHTYRYIHTLLHAQTCFQLHSFY